ncbi:MAG: ChbG/HpnK family deacetylase [Fidelibacterota bacterium]
MEQKISLLLIVVMMFLSCGQKSSRSDKTLLIRCDDIGMCHAVNMAAEKLIARNIPFSASVMVCCPWFDEAVEILKEASGVSVGVHLTLNSEWKNYKWGPVLGMAEVPGLVDEKGYFFPSRKSFFDNNPKTREVEKELEAQIQRALNSGLKIDYLDYHMGTAVSTPELKKIVEKLADKYELGISRWFGEVDLPGVYSVELSEKLDSLVTQLSEMESGKVNLLVCHIGETTPEMNAMEDMNSFGLENMSRHRKAEADALIAQKFMSAIDNNNIKLITYRDIIKEKRLKDMVPPEEYAY